MPKSLQKTIVTSCVVLAIVVMIALSIANRPLSVVKSGTHILMGTTVNITAVADDKEQAQQAIIAAIKQIKAIESVMSYYDSNSQLSDVNNRAYHEAVPVGNELFEVVQRSIEFSNLTEGAFDCTIAPLLELWRDAARIGFKPTAAELEEINKHIGSDKIILDVNKRTIKFTSEKTRIDLGGIAKGYAIDKAIEAMTCGGVKGGLIDAGGDIRCFGKAGNKKKWLIALQDPQSQDNTDGIWTFALKDAAITTSGDYYRYIVIEGEKMSHIIDPTAKTSAKGLRSVSIIAPNATTADALSTAITVLGNEKGLSLINSIDGIEALLITDSGQFIPTNNLCKYSP